MGHFSFQRVLLTLAVSVALHAGHYLCAARSGRISFLPDLFTHRGLFEMAGLDQCFFCVCPKCLSERSDCSERLSEPHLKLPPFPGREGLAPRLQGCVCGGELIGPSKE